VKVKILQPDATVRPEMNARVTFLAEAPKSDGEAKASLAIIPLRAVVTRDSGKAVLVVADGTVRAKPIRVARESGADVYVELGAGGLTGTEQIVVGDALGGLKPGDRVEIKK
jgi:multidrug efflux pump subunit AcrA (membrane-fusion protein)